MIFQHGLIPSINKPTRVSKKSATCIDHITTNSFLKHNIQIGIVKSDVSDHFPIFMISTTRIINTPTKEEFVFRRKINDHSIKLFKNSLKNRNWEDITNTSDPNEVYDKFLKTFSSMYEIYFPISKIKIKSKNLLSPWITKGLLKSSKRKQRLYDRFLKHRTYRNETQYKNYKNLFESLKLKSKNNYYSNLIIKYKNDIKKTWQVMKELLGKTKTTTNNLPKKIIVNNNEIKDKKAIAEYFNKFFVNVGPNLASSIPLIADNYKTYLSEVNCIQQESELTNEEFKAAFFALKPNKSPKPLHLPYIVITL